MEILKTFGFQPVLFAAQIVNFLILMFIFNKFLYKPILKTLSDRAKKIKQGMLDADRAAEERANAETERDKIIKTAGRESEKILSETKKAAEELRDEILTKARTDADKIIHDSKNQAKLEQENMEKTAKSAALDVSAAILERVLSNIFSPDEKNKIMKHSVETLKTISKE